MGFTLQASGEQVDSDLDGIIGDLRAVFAKWPGMLSADATVTTETGTSGENLMPVAAPPVADAGTTAEATESAEIADLAQRLAAAQAAQAAAGDPSTAQAAVDQLAAQLAAAQQVADTVRNLEAEVADLTGQLAAARAAIPVVDPSAGAATFPAA